MVPGVRAATARLLESEEQVDESGEVDAGGSVIMEAGHATAAGIACGGRDILESFTGAGVPVDRIVATGGLPHAAPEVSVQDTIESGVLMAQGGPPAVL